MSLELEMPEKQNLPEVPDQNFSPTNGEITVALNPLPRNFCEVADSLIVT